MVAGCKSVLCLVSFHRKEGELGATGIVSRKDSCLFCKIWRGISGFDELPGAGWTRMGQDQM